MQDVRLELHIGITRIIVIVMKLFSYLPVSILKIQFQLALHGRLFMGVSVRMGVKLVNS